MIKHSMKLAACIGIFGVAVLSNNAMAMNQEACESLPGNTFLAAVERGDCEINIQTAAGPAEEANSEGEEGGGRDNNCALNCRTRDGRNGGDKGGDGGGNRGGNPGGGNRAGKI